MASMSTALPPPSADTNVTPVERSESRRPKVSHVRGGVLAEGLPNTACSRRRRRRGAAAAEASRWADEAREASE